MTAVRVLVFVLGVALVVSTLGSAVRTVVLPRGVPSRLGDAVFTGVRWVFRLRAGRAPSYARRDAVFAAYGPVTLLVLLQVWLLLTFAGFSAMHWSVAGEDLRRALTLSGSSLLTLGFAVPQGAPDTALVFTEGSIGLVLLALLITYLPSLYSAFSRREAAVSKLEVRAGAPPTGAEMLWRAFALRDVDVAVDNLVVWEDWFIDIEETHTSFPALAFFRSPQPDRSWVTAAGAVLDAAALLVSSLEPHRSVDLQLVLRAGFIALRRICDLFGVPHPADPKPGDPIAVTRSEWEQVLDRLAGAGAPVLADRDAAWRAFAGWRVNYDAALLGLAALTQAPYAPWSSDRSLPPPAAPGPFRR